MGYRLFIDDERFPASTEPMFLARSSKDSIYLMESFGCPSFISFDHDLGGNDTAMQVVHWMISQDVDTYSKSKLRFIPNGFSFVVHSQNPIGAENIAGLLNGYLNFRKNEDGNSCA